MATTELDEYAMATEEQCRNAATFVSEWLKNHPQEGFGCVFNMWDILGGDSHFAQENAQNLVDFFLQLLAFFCNPENVKRFEKSCTDGPVSNYPQMLNRLATGFINMGRKGPQAELHAYGLRHFPSYRLHQIHSIYGEYESA